MRVRDNLGDIIGAFLFMDIIQHSDVSLGYVKFDQVRLLV
jgi:hypothetical protein